MRRTRPAQAQVYESGWTVVMMRSRFWTAEQHMEDKLQATVTLVEQADSTVEEKAIDTLKGNARCAFWVLFK